MKKYIKQVKKGFAAFLAVVIVMGAYVPVIASVPPPAPIPTPVPVPTPAPIPLAPATQPVQPLGERNHTTRGLSYENEPYLVITKQTNLVTAISSDELTILYRNYVEDKYALFRNSFVIGFVTAADGVRLNEWVTPNAWVSSDPSVFEVTNVSMQGIISLDFPERAAPIVVWGTVHGLGTTTITRTVTPVNPHTAAAVIGSFTITVAPYERTLVKASPGLVQIIGDRPVFLTQENITDLLEFAPSSIETRQPTPHPDRRMTNEELAIWIENYRAMGVNSSELIIFYWTNYHRTEHGAQPVSWCPRSSMAARLHTQLMREFNFFAHNDPFYGPPIMRVLMFNGFTGGAENASSGGGRTAVHGWMNSPPHRANMLNPMHRNIGIGTDRGSAQKF